jgi:hypothetical protein
VRPCNKNLTPESSSIIENISHWCNGSTQQAYAYFFFDGRDSQKGLQRHEHLIRSLIWQFSEQYDPLPKALNDLYDQCSSGVRQPSLKCLHNTLLLILDGFHHAYLIVDALDECTERSKLLDWIDEITQWRVGKLHLLATSRQERDIETRLELLGPSSLCLEGESVDLDIATYLDWMLRDKQGPKAWNRDGHIRDKIKTSLLQGAQGMYGPVHTTFIVCMAYRASLSGSDGLPCNLTSYSAV